MSLMLLIDAVINYRLAVEDPEIKRPWAFIFFMMWGMTQLFTRVYLVFFTVSPLVYDLLLDVCVFFQWAGNNQMKRILRASVT